MRSIAVLLFSALMMQGAALAGQTPATKPVSTAATTTDYSAEAMVVENLSTTYSYAEDGTGSREFTVVARIQSDAAARQWGVLSFGFAGNSERVEVEYVRARKPDGTVTETPASDAQEMPQAVTREAPFYSDLKEKQIPVRNLRMGDTLEYRIRIVGSRADAPGQFWGQDTLGNWAVILKESIELHVPKAKYVKVWSPTLQPVKTESGNEVVYRWTSSQLTPVAPKDSPLKHVEYNPKGELPTMAWTTFKSWEEVGTWYRGLEGNRATPDAAIKAKVTELIAGMTTEEEKAHALYNYVATQIRYIGVAFGIGRYQPHPAAEVMRNQYGDCKDKHTLLAAMLTAAGLKPSAALIGAGIRLNPEVPAPSAFNHMITNVTVAGKNTWLDTTAEVAPWGMLVATIRDKDALVVPDTGAAKLEHTQLSPPFASFGRFEGKGTLDKEGTMKARLEYTTRGDDELALRALLRQVAPGQWDELSQRLSQGFGFGGTTSHTEAGRPDKTDEPARISYDYEREKTGDWDNHRILPLFPVIFLNGVDEKYPPVKYAIQLGEPRVESAVSIIKLPAGWGAELPAAIHQKLPQITYDKTYKVEGDTITVERKMQVLEREVPAADWKAYKKWYDATVGEGEQYITLISTESKIGGNGVAGSANEETMALVKQFYEQMQRGEANAASETAAKIQKADPHSIWAYRCQIAVKAVQEKAEEAVPLTRELLKQPGVTEQDRMVAVSVFQTTKHYEDALPLLQTMAEAKPDDLRLQHQMGLAALRSGLKEKGLQTLTAVLEKATEPGILNDTAYELADAGLALPQAEAASRKAIDMLTEEAAGWSPGSASKDQAGKQRLLVATWDTLGWALFKEGKATDAEGWVRAAWLNMPNGEGALHMGEIEEKRGNHAKAMAYYRMGLSAANAYIPKVAKSMKIVLQPNPVADKLNAHIDALKKHGVPVPEEDPSSALTREETLVVGPHPGKGLLESYVITLAEGAVAAALPDEGTTPTDAGKALVLKAKAPGWVPTGSKAKILHKATLNCHSGVCDLIIHR